MTKRTLLTTVVTGMVLAGMAMPMMMMAAPGPKDTPPKVGGKAGNISALLPVAHISRGTGKAKSVSEAKKGSDLVWEDLVSTEKGGRARINLLDGSILSLGSQAELKIVQHDAKLQQTSLQLTVGRVRAEVTKITRDGGSFEVRTPTAVAGVIGTDFATTSSSVETEFVCISGIVNIGSSDPGVTDKVQCGPGMYVKVEGKKPPTQPKAATAEQIAQAIQDTEPATIGALSPASVLTGSAIDVAASGTSMANIKKVAVSGSGVQVSLNAGGAANTVLLHVVADKNAPLGPRVVTFTNGNGQNSAGVLTVLAPPTTSGEAKQSYHEVMDSERQAAVVSLNALIASLQQSAEKSKQQLEFAGRGQSVAGAESQLQAQVDALTGAVAQAVESDNQAAAGAVRDLDGRLDRALAALRQRNAAGTPDDAFIQEVSTAFNEVNGAMLAAFAAVQSGLGDKVMAANDSLNNLTQTLAGGFIGGAAGGEKTVELGDTFNFSAGGGLAGANSYQWSLCVAGKTCNALAGFGSTGPDFSGPSCNLTPGDYLARLVATDASGGARTLDYTLHVLPPAYDDPSAQLGNLAAAYSALQSSQFLQYFDATAFGGFTALQENMRRTFQLLSSMNINLRPSQSEINCNDATVRADWEQNYTFKQNTQVVFHQTEQLTARFARIPGKGWFINDFQGDNGTVQGVPPGPQTTDMALPELQIDSISSGDAQPGGGPALAQRAGISMSAANVLPIPPGPSRIVVRVHNVGKAPLLQPVKVHIALTNANGVEIGSTDVEVPAPLAVGQSVLVTGTVNVPQLPVGTPAQVVVISNPGCSVQLATCGASSTQTQAAIIGQPVVDLQVSNLRVTTATLIPGQQGTLTFQVTNAGNVNSSASDTYSCVSSGPGGSGSLGAGTVPQIGPNGSTTITLNFTVPSQPGSYTFSCSVSKDPNETVVSNNSTSVSATVLSQLPDLQFNPSPILAPAYQMGSSDSIQVPVRNGGLNPAAGGWNVVVKINGVTVGSGVGPALTSGQSATVAVAISVPNPASPPADLSQPLGVDLNANGVVAESNTANNVFTGTIRLQDFALTASPGPLTGVQGRPFSATVLTLAPSGFSLVPAISYSGAPAGLAGSGSPALKLAGSPSSSGTAVVTASGTVNGVSHAATGSTSILVLPEIQISSGGSLQIQAGGASGNLTVNVSGGVFPVSVTIAPPSGISTSSPATQTLNSPGSLTWVIQAASTATLGNAQVALRATDAGVAATGTPGGNVTGVANLTITNTPPAPNYVPLTPSIAGHTAAPFQGANALVVGENLVITVPVQNLSTTTATGNIDVIIDCFGPVCGFPQATTIQAPAGGQTVNAVFNFTSAITGSLPPGSYTGVISLRTSIAQSSTADDTENLPVDVISFTLTAQPPNIISPEQNIPVGGSGNINVALAEQGPSTLPIPITVAPPISGVTYTAPSNPVPPGPQVIGVNAASGTTAGSSAAVNVQATSHGVTRTVTQGVRFFTAGINNISQPNNTSSNPLFLPVGIDISFTNVTLQIAGNWNTAAGAAVLNVVPVAGFTISLSTSSVNPGDQVTLSIKAGLTAPSTVTPIPLRLDIPGTAPGFTAGYTLFVIAPRLPDLVITTIAPGGNSTGRNYANNPWLAGERVQWAVTVKNQGQAPSTGGQQVNLNLDGVLVGTGGPVPVLAAGAQTTVTVTATAPDAVITGPSEFLQAEVTFDPNESNGFNNFNSISVAASDWRLAVTGPGSIPDSAIILQPPSSNSGNTQVTLQLVGSGTALASFATSQGLTSTGINPPSIAQSTLNSGNSFQSNVTVSEVSSQIDSLSYAQVVATISGGTVKRGATIYINTIPSPCTGPNCPITDTVSITSSVSNFQPVAATSQVATLLQLNGLLPGRFTITPSRSGCQTGPCPGHVDLSFNDDQPVVANSAQLKSVPYGTPQSVRWEALENPDGTLFQTGPANSVVSAEVISISAVHTQPEAGTVNNIGKLEFKIGDLFLNGSSCIQVAPISTNTFSSNPVFVPVSGFNLPNLTWSWRTSSFPAGVQVNPVSGSSTFNGSDYGPLPTFVFSNGNSSNGVGTSVLFDVTLSNGIDTRSLHFDFEVIPATGFGCQFFSTANGVGGGGGRRGSWSKSAFGGGLTARSRPVSEASGRAPELSINAADVSFTPSVPKTGDTVEVRFRMSNTGNADASAVPVALQVDGTTVASDTFDVAAGKTVLGALQWQNARAPSHAAGFGPRARAVGRRADVDDRFDFDASARPLNAMLVIDPQHSIRQRTTATNSVALARLTLHAGAPTDADGPAFGGAGAKQRALLEVGDGACVGFRFASGVSGSCDSADVEFAVEDMGAGRYVLNAREGIADVGIGGGSAAAHFNQQADAIAGHTYTVQLSGGRVATLTVQAIRNPGQLGARTHQVFRGGSAGKTIRKLGHGTEPLDPGDTAGSGRREAPVTFDVLSTAP